MMNDDLFNNPINIVKFYCLNKFLYEYKTFLNCQKKFSVIK